MWSGIISVFEGAKAFYSVYIIIFFLAINHFRPNCEDIDTHCIESIGTSPDLRILPPVHQNISRSLNANYTLAPPK